MNRNVSIIRRIAAIFIDNFAFMVLAISFGLAGEFIYAQFTGTEAGSNVFPLIAFPVVIVGHFAYQYWSLLTGKPTFGQAMARFYVDASSNDVEPGPWHALLESLGVRVVTSSSTFSSATLHIVFATISLGLWPINLLLAAMDEEKRFWWAKLAGTRTVDMSGALKK